MCYNILGLNYQSMSSFKYVYNCSTFHQIIQSMLTSNNMPKNQFGNEYLTILPSSNSQHSKWRSFIDWSLRPYENCMVRPICNKMQGSHVPSPVFFRSPHPLDVVNNLSAAPIALTLSSFSIPLFLANRLELIALVCHSLNDVCHVGNETGNTGRCKNIRRKYKEN